mgnify:CR=1 FL=1
MLRMCDLFMSWLVVGGMMTKIAEHKGYDEVIEILKAGSLPSNQKQTEASNQQTVLWAYIPNYIPNEAYIPTYIPNKEGYDGEGMPSTLFIQTALPLPQGVSVQVLFEVIPEAPVNLISPFSCQAQVISIKARVKPGIHEFALAESQELEHIINGTEDVVPDKKKNKKRMEQIKKKEYEANRFTGIEIVTPDFPSP